MIFCLMLFYGETAQAFAIYANSACFYAISEKQIAMQEYFFGLHKYFVLYL